MTFGISNVEPEVLIPSHSFIVLHIICVTQTKDVSKHSQVEEAEKWFSEPPKNL